MNNLKNLTLAHGSAENSAALPNFLVAAPVIPHPQPMPCERTRRRQNGLCPAESPASEVAVALAVAPTP